MATELEANIALMASIVSLGVGLVLTVVGALAARRLDSSKLRYVSAGFLLLAAQGGIFAVRLRQDALANVDAILIPSLLGLAAMVLLYVAVYRRA